MKFLVFIVTVLFLACSNSEQSETQLTFIKKTLSAERCIDDNCAKVEASYPVAENAPAAVQINEGIMGQLLVYFNSEEGFDNLDSAANDFMDSYEEFKTDFPEAPGGWFAELEVTYESDSTLSFKFTDYNFYSGEHPNSSVHSIRDWSLCDGIH